MKRILFYTLSLSLFSLTQLEGQDPDITISGNFRDLPFVEFAEEVERQVGVTFYFLDERFLSSYITWMRICRFT